MQNDAFDVEVVIHRADHDAAPFAHRIIEGESPDESTELGSGLTALPVPGHTRGSVVYLFDDTYLFTGDSLTWDYDRDQMRAFRDACWYSWPVQKQSLIGLSKHPFNQLFSGHGPWSPWKDHPEMRGHLLELTARM